MVSDVDDTEDNDDDDYYYDDGDADDVCGHNDDDVDDDDGDGDDDDDADDIFIMASHDGCVRSGMSMITKTIFMRLVAEELPSLLLFCRLCVVG